MRCVELSVRCRICVSIAVFVHAAFRICALHAASFPFNEHALHTAREPVALRA